jgi:uncharacterized protein YdeI (YjbR/CyaY-like superfamily)
MTKKILNPAVDFYFDKTGIWQEAIKQLRLVVLDTGLTEELKWGCPCYSFKGSNIVLIHVFKEYCALLFFKGALLEDTKNILVQQTKNVQAARQVRFTDVKEIAKAEKTLKAYIQQAINVEKAGQKVDLKKTTEYTIPEEFQTKLNKQPELKAAFAALTPGRQRAYLLHFSAPKQSKTREARVKKYIPQILQGKGLND